MQLEQPAKVLQFTDGATHCGADVCVVLPIPQKPPVPWQTAFPFAGVHCSQPVAETHALQLPVRVLQFTGHDDVNAVPWQPAVGFWQTPPNEVQYVQEPAMQVEQEV